MIRKGKVYVMRKKVYMGGKGKYAHLYKLPAWPGLRRLTFRRDSLICQDCKVLCAGVYPALDSPTCDHITPHRGDVVLFLNPDNLQTLCKHCHDSAKAKIEARGYSNAPDATGWPNDGDHPANRRA